MRRWTVATTPAQASALSGSRSVAQLETLERPSVLGRTEHAAILVVAQHAVARGRLVHGPRRACARARRRRSAHKAPRPARRGARCAVGRRRAQRVERLVVGRAPKLRTGLGLNDAGRDPDLAVHLTNAAAQDVAGRRSRRSAARLGRHDEALRDRRARGRSPPSASRRARLTASAPPSTSNGNTTIGGLPATPRRAASPSCSMRVTSRCCQAMTATPPRSAATTTTARIRRQRRRLRAAALAQRLRQRPSWRYRPRPRDGRGLGARVRADDGIAAARQIDAHGIVTPFVGVILDQAAAQSARLDADERIRLRIEVRRTTEHLDGDV